MKIISYIFLVYLIYVPIGFTSYLDMASNDTVPKAYSLFTLEYNGNQLGDNDQCYQKDFVTSCNQADGECKARKGSCGEFLSTNFISQFEWTQFKSHYNGNQGFDGFYKIENFDVYIVIEDKTGTSSLNRQTKQMSLKWQSDRANKLVKYQLENDTELTTFTEEENDKFQSALGEGRVIGLLTNTTYRKNEISDYKENISYSFLTKFSLLGSCSWSESFQRKYTFTFKNYIYLILIDLPKCNFFEYECPLAYQLILNSATKTEEKNQEVSKNMQGCLFK